jgi:hypothetical protein
LDNGMDLLRRCRAAVASIRALVLRTNYNEGAGSTGSAQSLGG